MTEETKLKPCPFCGGKPECGVEFYESSGSNVILKKVSKGYDRCAACGQVIDWEGWEQDD